MILSVLTTRAESDLGEKLKQRDRAAWDQMVHDQHKRVFNLHLRLTGEREAAADLTQETFAEAYQSAHTYEGKSKPEIWLCGVALNLNRNWRRGQGRNQPALELDEDIPDPGPTAEQVAELKQHSELICDAVRRLPEVYQRTVALRYFAGVPAAEIAIVEGVDAGTVRWRLHQALRQLWVILQPTMGKEEQSESGAG